MPKTPPSYKNPHIKRIKFHLDLSNNNILDLSNTNIDFNHYFPPLQNCNSINLKTVNFAESTNITHDRKYINKRVNNFNKKMDTILEQLRQERKNNTPKKIKNNRYQRFIKTLDDISNNNTTLNTKIPTTSSKEELDKLLKSINNKYKLLNCRNINSKLLTDKPLLENKKKIHHIVFLMISLFEQNPLLIHNLLFNHYPKPFVLKKIK